MEKLRMRTMRFCQNNHQMYLATPPMENLINRCKIDEWDPLLREDKFSDIREWLEKQGYQRKPTITRLKNISKYLYKADRRNAIFSVFPSSIILSYRGELTFIPDSEGADHGYIELQANDTLYIIDGQHRFGGLKYAIIDDKIQELLSFQVPITILECKSKIDEIKQFALINRTQKRVKTDLGDRLLKTLKDLGVIDNTIAGLEQEDWKTRAVSIAEKLNSDRESPWHGRIIRPNSPRTDLAVAGESEFTKSLKPFLKSSWAKGISEDGEDKVYDLINEYWCALRDIMPEAFEKPSEFVIQKTPGFHSLNRILSEVTMKCTELYKKERNRKTFKKVLERINPERLESDWWKSGSKDDNREQRPDGAATYVGMGPIGTLADDFEREILENN